MELIDAVDAQSKKEAEELAMSLAGGTAGGGSEPPPPPPPAPVPPATSEGNDHEPLAVEEQDSVRRHVQLRILETVKFIDDNPQSPAVLESELRCTQMARNTGDSSGTVLIHMDLDLLTESAHAPHIRQPPWRKAQVDRLIKTVMAARTDLAGHAGTSKLIPGDVVLFKDAGKARVAASFWRQLLNNTKGA